MYAVNPKQSNKTYRIWIAHTEQEIDTILWMGVFSDWFCQTLVFKDVLIVYGIILECMDVTWRVKLP